MRVVSRLLLPLCCLLFVSTSAVEAATKVLTLHPPDRQQLDFRALSQIIEDEAGIRLIADPTDDPGDDPLQSLLDGSADLAILENTLPFVEGVRTVLPLYSGVVHLAARADLSIAALREAGRPAKVQLLENSYSARLVADLLFDRAAEIPEGYREWAEGDDGQPDFIIYVGPIHPQNTGWFRDGYELISLSRVDSAGAEFYNQGISYLIPQLQPRRIPALTYALPGNEEGIDALAVDMLLAARRDLDHHLVYRVVELLVEQKARFAAVEPALFRWLNRGSLDSEFVFPLHPGSRRYLERDEPGFLERYAESLNFLVYLMVLSVTGLLGLGRWRAKRRKDRIDVFYTRLLALRRSTLRENPAQALLSLELIEEEAFAALIGERLAADESFRIFTELAEGLRREAREHLITSQGGEGTAAAATSSSSAA